MSTTQLLRSARACFARPLASAFLAAIVAVSAPTALLAHEYELGTLSIGHPWSRATPPGAQVAAGYLTIENKGTEPDRLVSVVAEIANGGEIHEMSVDENGVMKMRPLADGITIEPGETATLKPGGLHLMFTRLTQSPTEGERFKGTLTFEKAGTIEVEFAVEAHSGEEGGAPAHDHSGH